MLRLFRSCGFFSLSIKLPNIPDNSPGDLTSLATLHMQSPLFALSKSPTHRKGAKPVKHSALLRFQHRTISRTNQATDKQRDGTGAALSVLRSHLPETAKSHPFLPCATASTKSTGIQYLCNSALTNPGLNQPGQASGGQEQRKRQFVQELQKPYFFTQPTENTSVTSPWSAGGKRCSLQSFPLQFKACTLPWCQGRISEQCRRRGDGALEGRERENWVGAAELHVAHSNACL